MAIANKDASQYSLKESGYLLIETLFNTLQTYLKAKEQGFGKEDMSAVIKTVKQNNKL